MANLVKWVQIILDSFCLWVFGVFPVTTESDGRLESFLQDSCRLLDAGLGVI